MENSDRTMNRLALESSPYLRQHARNPVDWYPWGPEAFERARREDRPIFLSIGYSACHWCHVMERESFENAQTAALMNRHFVNIKVDREERPDLDKIYMAATQAVTGGRGGWPMSVWLTPELEPFFAGTYFPPNSSPGVRSFPQLLEALAEAWQNQEEALRETAKRLRTALDSMGTLPVARGGSFAGLPGEAWQEWEQRYDESFGGFGGAPQVSNGDGPRLPVALRRANL